jgi:hypothetical protein
MITSLYRFIRVKIQILLAVMFGLTAVVILLYSLIYLKLFTNSESRLQNSVVLRFDAPTEYFDGNSYWWFTQGKNSIYLVNFSNELHQGVISLKLQQNPCGNFKSVDINSRKVAFNMSKKTLQIKEKFVIDAYQSKSLEIDIVNTEICKVENGDLRQFGAKLSGWAVK